MVTGLLPSPDLLKLNLEPGNGNRNKLSGVIVMPLIIEAWCLTPQLFRNVSDSLRDHVKRQIVTRGRPEILHFQQALGQC